MDNFDLTKFLKESKALENLNPTFKSLNENKHVKDEIREMILAELGNSDKKVNEYGHEMPAYNNSSPHGPGYEDKRYEELKKKYLRGDGISSNKVKDDEVKDDEVQDDEVQETLKNKIKEMILAELSEDTATDEAYDPVYENELEEAKKDEEDVEDVEVEDTETEEVPAEDTPEEDAPADEAPATGGGLEDIAADMEGTEGDLMNALMKSLKIAKGMGNEKLETQIGNTLKFFVSEYIGGEEK